MDESELKSCGLDDKQISKMDNEIQYLINSSDDILKKECGLDNVEIKMLRQAEKNAKNSTKKEINFYFSAAGDIIDKNKKRKCSDQFATI